MNDLIGLEYCWGAHPRDGRNKTDCFQLVCEIRTRLNMSDHSERFAWAYWWFTQETLNSRHVARWLLQSGKLIKVPKDGAVALLADPNNAALGTVVDQHVICIAPGGRVISLSVDRVKAYYFWVD